MTNVTTGPWPAGNTPAPRGEQDHAARHADALDAAIQIVEADPDDMAAVKGVCWFACRSPFKAVRAKALEAIRVAGDRYAE